MLVALNKSAVENVNGFTRDGAGAGAGPPGIEVAVETVVSTHSDFEDRDSPESMVDGFSHIGFGDSSRRLGGSEKMA